ncbi:MAG: hypothetical protein ACRENP_22130 [Longimicrobiales bacterium]
MEISRLWAAMLTRNVNNAGTNHRIVLVINANGQDLLNHEFVDTTQKDQEQAQANLYEVNVRGKGIDPAELNNSSIRVGILGSDAWRAEHFMLWGERLSPFFDAEVIPLALETGIPTQISTDDDEGPSSFPLRLVGKGNRDMAINRIFLLFTTAGQLEDDDLGAEGLAPQGTDSPIEIQIVSDGRLVVLSEIRDTHQDDAELGGANFYSAPVITPFTRRALQDRSITLRVKGLDSWEPASLFLFGLDDAAGRPESLVPLVHLPRWPFGLLEADTSTGVATVTLPLVPDHSFPGNGEVVHALESIASGQNRIIEMLQTLAAR